MSLFRNTILMIAQRIRPVKLPQPGTSSARITYYPDSRQQEMAA